MTKHAYTNHRYSALIHPLPQSPEIRWGSSFILLSIFMSVISFEWSVRCICNIDSKNLSFQRENNEFLSYFFQVVSLNPSIRWCRVLLIVAVWPKKSQKSGTEKKTTHIINSIYCLYLPNEGAVWKCIVGIHINLITIFCHCLRTNL